MSPANRSIHTYKSVLYIYPFCHLCIWIQTLFALWITRTPRNTTATVHCIRILKWWIQKWICKNLYHEHKYHKRIITIVIFVELPVNVTRALFDIYTVVIVRFLCSLKIYTFFLSFKLRTMCLDTIPPWLWMRVFLCWSLCVDLFARILPFGGRYKNWIVFIAVTITVAAQWDSNGDIIWKINRAAFNGIKLATWTKYYCTDVHRKFMGMIAGEIKTKANEKERDGKSTRHALTLISNEFHFIFTSLLSFGWNTYKNVADITGFENHIRIQSPAHQNVYISTHIFYSNFYEFFCCSSFGFSR